MKIIVAGASGFVGSEVVRQAVRRPEVTSVIALSRTAISTPSDTPQSDSAKLKSIVVDDYGSYPDDVKQEFAGAHGCIWSVAIVPSKSKNFPFEEVVRVCQTSTLAGLRAMVESQPTKPFRFMYVSGIAVERDQTKTPPFFPEYLLMRVSAKTENQMIQYSSEHPGIEAASARPGHISSPERPPSDDFVKRGIVIEVSDLAVVLLNQVIGGFDKDPLLHQDLLAIAERVRAKEE
ncbi:hypothetical protein DL93DRAFT_2058802 [Clavulina sp. PMI_390]|nr:hypothetical protein DL93DRAFT_2058802 [Clavulina sp. PMI_390]